MKRFALLLMILASPAMAAEVNHWPLSDKAESTDVDDPVGGDDGTLLGGDNTIDKTTTGPGGLFTAAFDLNGTDDAVDISAASLSFTDGTAFSVSFWWRPDSTTFEVLGRAGTNDANIRQGSATVVNVATNLSSTAFTVPSITAEWHHGLVTRTTGNSVRFFLDGTESSSGAQTLTGTFNPNRIGVRNVGFADGKIAGVRVYNTDESANVATLYAEGFDAPAPQPNLSGNFELLNGNMQ